MTDIFKNIADLSIKTTSFALAAGTDDERALPWNAEAKLGENHDQLFGLLAKMHAHASAQAARQAIHPMQNPAFLMTECLWLVWCYASHDITRLQQQNADLERRIAALEAALASPAKTEQDDA
jgi:hypothetical protein